MPYNFIHIPKAAGSSIYQIIDVNNTVAYSGHTRIVDIPTIAVTRHPYDRIISAYFYLIEGGGQVEPDLGYCEMLKKYTSFKDSLNNLLIVEFTLINIFVTHKKRLVLVFSN